MVVDFQPFQQHTVFLCRCPCVCLSVFVRCCNYFNTVCVCVCMSVWVLCVCACGCLDGSVCCCVLIMICATRFSSKISTLNFFSSPKVKSVAWNIFPLASGRVWVCVCVIRTYSVQDCSPYQWSKFIAQGSEISEHRAFSCILYVFKQKLTIFTRGNN